jgi:hypothetical protein
LTVIAIIFFLPETLPSIAGNGTLRLTGMHRPLVDRFIKEPPYMRDRDESHTPTKVNIRTFIEPLFLLREKNILLSLIFGGMIYAIWSMVTASTVGLFKEVFLLNELQIGLVFLPNGADAPSFFYLCYLADTTLFRSRYNCWFNYNWKPHE